MTEPKIYNSLSEAMFSDYKPPRWYENLYYWFYRKYESCKYKVKKIVRTIKYGFPNWHWYEFKTWHSAQVAPRLKRFRNNLSGYPSGLTEELWAEYLDAMIWSFEHHDDNIPLEYSEDYDRRVEKIVGEKYTTFKPLNESGTVSFKKIEEHQTKVKYGLELFAKYYTNLWD